MLTMEKNVKLKNMLLAKKFNSYHLFPTLQFKCILYSSMYPLKKGFCSLMKLLVHLERRKIIDVMDFILSQLIKSPFSGIILA